ncbi:MAG: HAD hydrolase-like protein [Pedobacter sp.]|nr:HAD hydrolase-like protein [Pedobacter sp.]
MAFETYIAPNTAFIFGLDNVLYPEKDYLLQVYYLFSEFMEYSAQLNAQAITDFMQLEYAHHGSVNIFEKTAAKFDIQKKYKSNFLLLHENARLPLKLLLFQKILSFLQEILMDRKKIYLIISGNKLVQLNKIKQMEWHGLEHYLKAYFSQELEPSLTANSIDFVIDQNQLKKEEVLYVGSKLEDQEAAKKAGIEFLQVTKLL